jgi:hypothetical protein
MLTIWGRRSSFNLQKVMWLVGELAIEHRHIEAGGRFGGLDTPQFLAMNPHGRASRSLDGLVADGPSARFPDGRLLGLLPHARAGA